MTDSLEIGMNSISHTKITIPSVKSHDYMFFTLLGVALFVDLFSPYLIWKGLIPEAVRWISHGAIAVMMFIAYLRMMAFDLFPGVTWVIIAISLVSGYIAIYNGQGLLETLWGWWTFFQYLFVGLFAYLQPTWPDKFKKWVIYFLIFIIAITLAVQVGQYLLGQSPGDNLAGLFGSFGTARLVVFILLTLCIALGFWITQGKWHLFLIILGLGSLSSVLGEIKLFPFASGLLGLVAIVFFLQRGRNLGRLFPYSILLAVIVGLFFVSFNTIVPGAERRPLETFLNVDKISEYFGLFSERSNLGPDRFKVGRNYALSYAWDSIRQDNQTFLLGMGLGARGESQTLGTTGVAFLNRGIGSATGSSIIVIMQELALFGTVALGGFFLWLVIRLFKDIREEPDSDLSALRYGILFFSLLWPLWLYYSSVWSFRVAMLIYWVLVGYVLSHSNGKGQPVAAVRARVRES